MLGLMQDWPLLCTKIIDHAAIQHKDREIVSRSVEGPIHRTTYSALRQRSLQCAKRLEQDGIVMGDRVATLAWNTWRHMEVWYGLLGLGAIYHTVNPRLFPDQIVWIINHAEDRILFVDLTFVPLIEAIADKIPSVEKIIILTDDDHMPETGFDAVSYETWLAEADDDFIWKSFDENTAAGLCYTSGTTGDPKGVVYSHRSNVLHAMIANAPDMAGLSARDTILPVVPMFHANSWALAFSAPMAGATMVLPGAGMDGPSIFQLLDEEKVTITAAVPTVWFVLLQYLDAHKKTLPYLERVIIGGAACPRSVIEAFEERYDTTVCHAWGMTETSPLGSACSIKPDYADLTGDDLFDIKVKQGHAPFTVEMEITDDDDQALAWDGSTFGRLKVRGPAISKAYFKQDGLALDDDGFFDTGDVGHIDPYGYLQITDRSKDIIKSGGEWISSIELENAAVGHPDVTEAAVIGIPHPKWNERPLLIIVPMEGKTPSKTDMISYLESRVAKWWLPDDVILVDEIPHTATGKIKKTELRKSFASHTLP